MDDDFDLPDESSEIAGRSSSFINDLFGNKKPTAATTSNRSTFDDLLASGPKRKPTVTFQDGARSPSSARQDATRPAGSSSSLLDSLFPSTTAAGDTNDSVGADTLPRSKRTGSSGIAVADSVPSKTPSRQQQQQPSLDIIQRSNPVIQAPPSQVQSVMVEREVFELEQLRKEVSTLRYEKSEDQKIIIDLRRRLEFATEDNQKVVANLHEQHRGEIQELNRKHERELEGLTRTAEKNQEILNSIKQQEGSFDNVQSRIETLGYTLSHIRGSLEEIGSKKEEIDKVVGLVKREQVENQQRLEAEKQEWQRQKDASIKRMEQEMIQITDQYSKEIIQGRRWLEQERQRISAERLAFQQEQTLILDWIEKKRDELEANKSNFLTKEHDLLIRVVNEKALLEHERRDFERQRNLDVVRLREEAEHLESSLAQVENARNALAKAQREYEQKNDQLNEIKEMLVEYEQAYWKESPK